MGQWLKNINSNTRRRSRRPKVVQQDETRVYDKPCYCREQKGSEPGHIHGSAPVTEQVTQ